MKSDSLAAYEKVLDAADLDVIVDLIGALLIGVTFNRYIVGEGPLATLDP